MTPRQKTGLSILAVALVLGGFCFWEWQTKIPDKVVRSTPAIYATPTPSGKLAGDAEIIDEAKRATQYEAPTATPVKESSEVKHEEAAKQKARESLILISTQPTPAPTAAPEPTPEPGGAWLPPGRFIPCVMQTVLQSSHMTVAVLGIVTEDVFSRNDGKGTLIIPAGSRLMAMISPGYTRDRIEVAGSWKLIIQNSGRTTDFDGIAYDEEFDPKANEYGMEDKTPGILGKVIESDHYVRFKAIAGLLLHTAAATAGQIGSAALQSGNNGNNSVQFSNVAPETVTIADKWIDEILNGHHTDLNDTLYVEVAPAKPFYVLNTSAIDLSKLERGGFLKQKIEEQKTNGVDDTLTELLKDERSIQKQLRYNYEQTPSVIVPGTGPVRMRE